jgi:hypothetical protein
MFRPSVVTDAAMLGRTVVPETGSHHRFSAVAEDVQTWNALVMGSPTWPARISRADALSVPAVLRARNLICSTIGGLPLQATNAAGERVEQTLLAQPEQPSGFVRSVTITATAEDLLLDGSSLWTTILRNAAGFPSAVERVDHRYWQQDPTTGEITVNGRTVRADSVILFTSPNPPLLSAGARAITALLRLEETAARYANEPEASHYFTSRDGVDPDEDETTNLLTSWLAARRRRGVAYVPSAYALSKLERLTPEELQLISAREMAIKQIAQLTGIDAEELSVSTTSRTYANSQDRRRSFTDFTLGPLLHAIEERLSLGDVTPRGQSVRFNLDAFLRADTAERYASYAVALDKGFLTLDEVRALENRPALEIP